MRLRYNFHIALLAAAGLSAQAQQPGNPNPGDPNNQNNGQVNASILEHGSGLDQMNQGPFVTGTDRQYAQNFAMRAMMQIELGKIAKERGSSSLVKLIAQRMIDDYSKWQGGLQRAATRLEIKLPTELDGRRRDTVKRLSALSGEAFDREYVKEMLRINNRALNSTQYEAANAGVTGFRNWAGLIMPTLLEHQKLTKQGPPVSAAK